MSVSARVGSAGRLMSRRALGFAIALVAASLVAPIAARAAWVEPVVGPLNQRDASASDIRGDGSEPLVAMTQFGPGFSSPTLQVASLRSAPWQLSVPLERVPGAALGSSVALTASGPVYGAWIETRTAPTVNAEVYIARYAGASIWNPVAGSLNHNETQNAQPSSPPTIANVGGVPWVAWQEGPDSALWVARVDGGNVSYVGSPFAVGNVAASPSLTSVNGVAFLAYSDAQRLHVATFQNGAWTDVPGLVAPGGFFPSIANVGGRIFVAWSEYDANQHVQLHVARYVGNGHWIADQSLNIDGNENAYSKRIASVGGVPWIAWTESSRPYADNRQLGHVYVKQFNGASWDQVGGVLNIDQNQSASEGGIADVAGKAYVAITQSQSDGGSAVRVEYAQQFVPLVSGVATVPAQTKKATSGSRAIRFRVTLSEAATIRLDFMQPGAGRLDRGVCVAVSSRQAHRGACTLDITRGQRTFSGHAGVNTLLFDGTLANRTRLKSGTYQVVISAIGASGLSSASSTVRVKI
jgi:hypothetical protein